MLQLKLIIKLLLTAKKKKFIKMSRFTQSLQNIDKVADKVFVKNKFNFTIADFGFLLQPNHLQRFTQIISQTNINNC